METKFCKNCGENHPLTKEYFYTNGFYPSGKQKWKPTCKVSENKARRATVTAIIAEYFPVLECSICGYNKCEAALEFHHLDQDTKDIDISRFRSSGISRDRLRVELQKCILVCANCHREIHYNRQS